MYLDLWTSLVFALMVGASLCLAYITKKALKPNGRPVKVSSLPDGEYKVLMRREVATREGQQILFILGQGDIGESVRDALFCHVRQDMVDIFGESTWETLSIRRYEGLIRITLYPQRSLEPKEEKELATLGEKR